ncbi:unnamed protein product [Vitrella brassicaformis CCMP3155]|uniref:Uncharacterized protein n=1 Tax=Vitrella brassicaformis (strain CCMP3155) TaxID=1169540 RepID=A0A0G4EXB6_VITBC|nr:unnamed protein product [Vitrella brassicaformis CCMP3155]|eukprot:CEM03438.1 unnamed protein product [Vitrella brassicaformis CCMP3155]
MPPLRIFSLSLSGQREHPTRLQGGADQYGKMIDWELLVHLSRHARFGRTRQVGRIPNDRQWCCAAGVGRQVL